MFQIQSPTTATLKTLTPRTETHGGEKVSAMSFGLKITGPNTMLDALQPGLRDALYRAVEGQDQLPGVEPATPLLRSKGIESVKLKACFEGWTLKIDAGIDENDPIAFGSCEVDAFQVVPSEGGIIDLHFRVGTSDIDQDEAGWMFGHLQQEIDITLHAPQVKPDAIDGTGEEFAADHPDAGDLFAAQHGGPADDGCDPDIEDDEDAGPELEDRLDNALAAADAETQRGEASKAALDAVGSHFGSREAELQAEAAAGTSTRTARGRDATKKALAEGMAAAKAAGTMQ